MSFNSNDNKALLWSLMYEGGVFTNIPQEHLAKVKDIFERKITILNKSEGTVLEKNKKAMMDMVKELETLRTKPTLKNVKERNYDTPVTSNDIQMKRRETFNNNLEKRQSEFNDMMTVKTPDKPDFSDSPDNPPIGSEMDQLLADMIAKRNLQLSNVTANHDASAAQEWITKDNSNPESFSNTIGESTGAPTLKIGEALDKGNVVENIRLDVKDELDNRKHVTFADTKPDINDKVEPRNGLSFFEKFKKTARDNREIIEEIKTLRSEITNKLSKIDELLVELS